MHNFIKESFIEAHQVLDLSINNQKLIDGIDKAIDLLTFSLKNGNKAYSCGNGGSMCDASHFAEELTGRFRKERAPLPATAISDSSHISCVANDYGFEHIFSRFVEAWGSEGDVLLAISTSGNSPNIIRAVNIAKEKNMKTIGLLGKDGGKLIDMVDIPLLIESNKSDRVQEMHIKIIHTTIEGIERNLFPSNY